MENVLEIKDLSYRKNQKTILERVNLELQPGKIVALLGANGAGKTTLMRIISGTAKNYKGEVAVAGESDETKRKSHLSFTDGLSGFSDGMRIRDVKTFYKEIFTDFDSNQFDQLLVFMNLNEDNRLKSLSKGMREKLIIALTFSRKTDLYLLDEPFGGVDVMSRKKIIKSMILWKPDNATILISDHFINEVSSLLDEVVLVKNHSILEHRTADEIRENNESVEQWYENFYEGEE